MNRLTAILTAAALSATGLFTANATTAAPQTNPEPVQLAQLKLKKVPQVELKLLCSPKYLPSSNAKTASKKGGSYTCLHQMPMPPGKHCRNGFDPTTVEAKVVPGGKYVRLTYRCQSHPW
ncbi:MAG: hypothetical protein ACLFWF_01560 [Alphaproteobacteria bacterium]